MIEFIGDCHANKVTVSIGRPDVDFTAIIGGEGFEDALDGLLDGCFLDDWLRETMTAKLENYFDRTPSMTDEELQRFIGILEDML